MQNSTEYKSTNAEKTCFLASLSQQSSAVYAKHAHTLYIYIPEADFDPFLHARPRLPRKRRRRWRRVGCRLLRCVMGSRLRSVWRKHIDSPAVAAAVAVAADLVLLYRSARAFRPGHVAFPLPPRVFRSFTHNLRTAPSPVGLRRVRPRNSES